MENQVTSLLAEGDQLLFLAPEVILSEAVESVVAAAESAFRAEAFGAIRHGRFVEVELVDGSAIIEAVYDAASGELQDTQTLLSSRRGRRAAQALDRAVLSLADAMDVAKGGVGPGETLEACLHTAGASCGRRFDIVLRTSEGTFEVFVDAATGRLSRVVPHY